MAKLLLSLEGITIREVALVKDRTTIGRRPYSDIVVDSPVVSGEHAVVHLAPDGQAAIEDLQSVNGTVVNGVLVLRQNLKHGDVVEIGRLTLTFDQEPGSTGAARRSGRADAAAAQAASDAERDAALAGIPLFAETATAPDSGAAPVRPAAIRILSGAAAGRAVDLHKVVTTIGKSGIGVAAITRRPQGFILAYVEGEAMPFVNGVSARRVPVMLRPGDLIELAGIRMQFDQAA
ncbi:FHA domain-containing protein [Xylophilus ampelinus]|uniref:FHA domain-containing protein n=1 Tax=Xylophilus ampelinus TaxID=54067 RepID=A0A318SE82_9BURK|nr:FHA domain-containing protein [Xylophilus ampelinus]MCS4511250.1 FHA domain-containing protein [Xylophilus ampelinus]PYE74996.1 FHA domain-containing protein [Xylophilus ampelinus]